MNKNFGKGWNKVSYTGKTASGKEGIIGLTDRNFDDVRKNLVHQSKTILDLN